MTLYLDDRAVCAPANIETFGKIAADEKWGQCKCVGFGIEVLPGADRPVMLIHVVLLTETLIYSELS